MQVRNILPSLSLLLTAAIVLLSSAYASPSDASVIQPVQRTAPADPLYRQLQSLKESGDISAGDWQLWREARQQENNRPSITGTLDAGGEDCASATVIPGLPYADTGTTSGAADNYNYYCPWEQSGAPDVVYSYTPVQNSSVTIDLCGSSYDTKLFVYAGDCTGDPVACNDDACGDVWGYPWASKIDCLPVSGGTTYYIVVDGFFEWEYGDYVLHVDACTPCVDSPVHDLSANAKAVTTFPYTDTDNTACAHHECDAFPGIYTEVWYRITLTDTSDLDIGFCGTVPVLSFAATALMTCDAACTPVLVCNEETYVVCSDFNPTLQWAGVLPGTYWYPVISLAGSGQPYTITISGPVTPVEDFSGTVTLTDTRPTNRRFTLTHESGTITWFAFTGFCPGTTGQTVSHADSTWDVLTNGDGNDGDSIIFVASEPLTSGSIETFVLRYPECASDLNWVVGSNSGIIPGGFVGPSHSNLVVHQNVPNPFNPSTTIRFDLMTPSHVRVSVYNVMGQRVAELMDEMATAGAHSVQFDAGNLSSGVYIYQIDTPESHQRLKMLLVK